VSVGAQVWHRVVSNVQLALHCSQEVKYPPDPTAPPSAMFGRSAWALPDGGEEKK
jgi:hypothetical protein